MRGPSVGTEIAIGLLAAALAFAVFKVLRGGLDGAKFVVRVRGEGVEGIEVKGAVPGKSSAEVADFVAGLELPAGARIWGVPDRDRIMLRFSAQVPENLQQRIRNYFYN